MSQSHPDYHVRSLLSYNIAGKLGAIGRSILVRAVHEMDDARDIRQFVCSSKSTHDVMSDALFPWSLARGLSRSYSLSSVPTASTDLVCFDFSQVLHFF